MDVGTLNALAESSARAELLRCCGSTRWACMMAASRPFASADAMLETGAGIWRSLERTDWLEAFAAHPRIGESRTGGPASSADWAEQEQSGARTPDTATRDRLAQANREYEARFGHIFIICATGRSAGQVLAAVERRLANQPDEELKIAAAEQWNITRLRMAKLLT
jgi:2-oxo-4-hydroxy-4-carboxy-5-ureidoimidazoline decarboxylase